MLIVRFAIVLGLILAVNATAGGMVRPVGAVAVAGEAYALAAGASPVVVVGSPRVTLPASGGTVTDSTPGAGLGLGSGAGNADGLTATATGDADAGTVSSTVGIDLVELFGGVIRATDLRVTATASVAGRGGSGSTLSATSLTVGGLVYTDARPNTRVELPGLGYAILNEQFVGGDGGAASINAIHLWVTVPSALGVPAGTEIIVAHAAAGGPDLDASRAVPSGPAPSPTPVPWAALSPLAPIDISISDNGNGNDNFTIGNSNNNDNRTAAGAGAGAGAGAATTRTGTATTGTATTGTSSSGGSVVVTVVVVVPTSAPSTPTTSTQSGGCSGEACPRP